MFTFYILISLFPDATPQEILSSKFILWELHNTKHSLRKSPPSKKKQQQQQTRKFLTIECFHHLKADVNRLYIKRQNGGRGLVELESAYNAAIVGRSKYIKHGKDRLTRLVQEYDAMKTKCCLQKEANLIVQKYMTQDTAAQNFKNQLKSSIENKKIEELKRKPMHGQFFWDFERLSVDKEKSLALLCNSGLSEKLRV